VSAAFPVHVEEHALVDALLRAVIGQPVVDRDSREILLRSGIVVPHIDGDRLAEGVLARLSIAGAHVLARQVLRPDVAVDLGCCRVSTKRGRMLRGKTQRLADGALRVEHRVGLLQTRVVHVQIDTWATCDELPTDELLAELRAERESVAFAKSFSEAFSEAFSEGVAEGLAEAISQDHQAAATAAATAKEEPTC